MRNFIIFFEEKEGTSPLVRLLDNFEQISVVHQVGDRGWEPFDRHNCGWLSMSELTRCFELIFDGGPLDLDRLNGIYAKKAVAPLDTMDKSGSVGFKMRFLPPNPIEMMWLRFMGGLSETLTRRDFSRSFERTMIEASKANDLTIFLAVRQDVFRWALSKYHGDGTGKPGHLQFKLASGAISKSEIGKIHVDRDGFEQAVSACEESHAEKRRLMGEFQAAGIPVHPLLYEDFLADKRSYFARLLELLEIEIAPSDLDSALELGGFFQKVHSDDISEFVENHEEVIEIFGERFVEW